VGGDEISRGAAARSGAGPRPSRRWSVRCLALVRWLHIYLSLFGFATILFFSLTGLTLNHPDWFGGWAETTETVTGQLDPAWLAEGAELDAARLERALRASHPLRGTAGELRDDATEVSLSFAGPGYAAEALIRRPGGDYDVRITQHGLIALINDLHKGRDTGPGWSVVIDLSALLMGVSAVTGLVLLLSLRKKCVPGLLAAAAGTVALWLAWKLLVR